MLSDGLHTPTVQRGIERAHAAHERAARPTLGNRRGRASHPDRGFRRSGPARPLSRREREILALLCLRLTDLEIADRLFVSRRTVTTHVSNILAKLDVANRREAAALAGRMQQA